MKPRAKGSQAAALWVGAVLTSFSCQWPSGPDPVDSDPRSGATTDSTDTTDATDTTDEAPDDTAAERPNLTARLVDPDGAPLGQLSASACSDVLCYVARTSGSGRLEFRVMRTGRWCR